MVLKQMNNGQVELLILVSNDVKFVKFSKIPSRVIKNISVIQVIQEGVVFLPCEHPNIGQQQLHS